MTDEEKKLQQQKAEGTLSKTAQQSTGTTAAAQTTAQTSSSTADTALSDTAYDRAMATLQEAEKNKPVYAGAYDEQINEIYNKIVNRDTFKYSAAEDPTYQQYKDSYTQAGQQAMRDTMGQAAGLTGGYGSSYSQSVGQQTYDRYMSELADKIPELSDAAYERYTAEGEALQDQYAMLGDMRDTEYSRYQDELNAWENERAYAANQESAAYSRQQNAYTKMESLITGQGYQPSDQELSAAGMSREEADALLADWAWDAYANEQISANRYAELTGELPNGYTASSGGTGTGSAYDQFKKAVDEAVSEGESYADINSMIVKAVANGKITTEEGKKLLRTGNDPNRKNQYYDDEA